MGQIVPLRILSINLHLKFISNFFLFLFFFFFASGKLIYAVVTALLRACSLNAWITNYFL